METKNFLGTTGKNTKDQNILTTGISKPININSLNNKEGDQKKDILAIKEDNKPKRKSYRKVSNNSSRNRVPTKNTKTIRLIYKR